LKEKEKRDIVLSLYGKYFVLLKENADSTLKDVLDSKPALKDGVITKLESMVTKLVEKGLTRHTIVQAVLYDYVTVCGEERL
jgi:hypothetical protein